MELPTEAEVRAEPAGRRLDAWVAEIVMGWPKYTANMYRWDMDDGGVIIDGDPKKFPFAGAHIPDDWHPSSDWSAAGPLLEDDAAWQISHIRGELHRIDASDNISVDFDPGGLCRAICIARILAKQRRLYGEV